MIKATVITKIKLPKEFNMTPTLRRTAERIIIPEIVGHIAKGKDIDGNTYEPLDPKTIKAKGDDRHLIDTGELFHSFSSSTRGKNKVIVRINNIRKQIAKYLQIEGVRSKKYGRRRFNFFGINEKMEEKASNFMSKEVEKRLKRGR